MTKLPNLLIKNRKIINKKILANLPDLTNPESFVLLGNTKKAESFKIIQ